MKDYLSLIKFSHTIFAIPFAIIGFTLGVFDAKTGFDPDLFVKVILCMVFARSAAMAFNRYLDRDIDKLNPRTSAREIPAGVIGEKNALLFTGLNVGLFVSVTYFINNVCFLLSPVALAFILGYSYTKRFTSLCHVVLGISLALAPVGAFLAVTGQFKVLPVLLGFVVMFWVSGFDIIYALQDDIFDKSQKLHSIPVNVGRRKALLLSRVFHLASALILLYFVYLTVLSFPAFSNLLWIGYFLFISMLFYQHTLVKENDLSRVGLAFFTFNGIASLLFGLVFIADAWLI